MLIYLHYIPELILTLTAAARDTLHSRALIIFAKNPLPGAVKTRLSPPLTPEDAASLYRCMILDTIHMATALRGVSPFIFFQEDPGAADFFRILAPGTISHPQVGEDLGERMKNAFAKIFSSGFSAVAIIGTDSPDLPPEFIMKAFALLAHEQTDVIFGPAEDGGYYLLALKRVWEELFTGLPWSSSGLLAASVTRAGKLCLGSSLLPAWYDIDTAADLDRPGLMEETCTAITTRQFLISRHRPDSRHFSDR